MTRARIVVADDHKGIRDTVVQLLKRECNVLEAVGDGQALLEAVTRLSPDLCVLDISMPVMSGIEVASILKGSPQSPKLVFLTIHDDKDFVMEAFKTGAEGYVIKQRMAADLIFAVKEVMAGRTFVSKIGASQAKRRPQ